MSIKFYPLLKNIDIITVRTKEKLHVYAPQKGTTRVGNIKCWKFLRSDGLHEVFASDINELRRRLRFKYGRDAKIKIHYNR